ncbi:MAG: helix-turn-helix domain-containing protein [Candidatus Competibacteraceae bacterium]|nr:helix-turn-helix domain-containing protein [Candidatus Competibacteraceae bacterium]
MAKKRESSTKTAVTAEQVIKAIKSSGGVKTTIAKRLNVTRQTVDNYLRRWVSVRDAYLEEKSGVDDAALSVVMQDIVNGRNVQTAKWWIERKLDEFKPKHDLTIKEWKIAAQQAGLQPDEVEQVFEADVEAAINQLFKGKQAEQ